MNRSLKNAVAVLLATALTALVIFGGVEIATVASGGGNTASAATVAAGGGNTPSAAAPTVVPPAPTTNQLSQHSTLLTCPRTGCTASTCHGTTGRRPPRR